MSILERVLPMADIPTIFQEIIGRTLENCTPAWLDDIIVVTRRYRRESMRKNCSTC